MQTLLEKVQTVEEEAAHVIASAQEAGRKQLDQLMRREEQVIADIRAKAEKKAEAIIAEHVHKVGTEINSIKQESEHAVDMVHKAAEANREQALARARKLFEDTYLSA